MAEVNVDRFVHSAIHHPRVAIVFLAGIATPVIILLIWAAPGPVARFNTAYLLGMTVAVGAFTAWIIHNTLQRAERALTRADQALDEASRTVERAEASMSRVSVIISEMSSNPRTAAAGQRAMDEIRNVWGGKADEWLDRGPLN